MPFSDPKKIEQVLGYELESQILGELEGLVYDSVISTTRLGERARRRPTSSPSRRKRSVVRAKVEALAAIGAEPRVVGAAALSYAALRGHAFAGEGDDAAGDRRLRPSPHQRLRGARRARCCSRARSRAAART